MGKVLPFPCEKIQTESPAPLDTQPRALAGLFEEDDALNGKTVAQIPWHEAPIVPQSVIPLDSDPRTDTPVTARLPVSAPAPAPAPARTAARAPSPPLPAPPPFTPYAPPTAPQMAQTVVLPSFHPMQPPRAHVPMGAPTVKARLEVVPARPAWTHALVAVALTLVLLIPAIAVVAYFAVRTGDSPVMPIPSATATPIPR